MTAEKYLETIKKELNLIFEDCSYKNYRFDTFLNDVKESYIEQSRIFETPSYSVLKEFFINNMDSTYGIKSNMLKF